MRHADCPGKCNSTLQNRAIHHQVRTMRPCLPTRGNSITLISVLLKFALSVRIDMDIQQVLHPEDRPR
jgi:hypothetical protein